MTATEFLTEHHPPYTTFSWNCGYEMVTGCNGMEPFWSLKISGFPSRWLMKTLAVIYVPESHFAQFFSIIMVAFPFSWRQTPLPPVIFLIAFSSVSVCTVTVEKKNSRRLTLGGEGPGRLKGGGYFLANVSYPLSSVRRSLAFQSQECSHMCRSWAEEEDLDSIEGLLCARCPPGLLVHHFI